MRRLYLIRHAKAGDRDRFPGDDSARPLTANGRRQADTLGGEDALGPLPDQVLSSPARRCVETVEPLAKRVGVAVETAKWLSEGRSPLEALARLRTQPGDVVAACTHGDIIWGVLEWLARGGVELVPRPDAPKASTWVLDWEDPSAEGVPLRATYLPPPVKDLLP